MPFLTFVLGVVGCPWVPHTSPSRVGSLRACPTPAIFCKGRFFPSLHGACAPYPLVPKGGDFDFPSQPIRIIATHFSRSNAQPIRIL